jgi:HAE1 family hydrophobic/amphiphilic exporter-1
VFGFSINTLTLFGLTLATGLVVDDAIVVIENIERIMHEKKLSPRKAASEGMKEVAGAVVAITLVLVAVFVPVAAFPGTTGAIYRQFALTIAASMAIPAVCALTLTPTLSARLLKAHHGEKWIGFRKIDQLLDGMKDIYARFLTVILKRPVVILFSFLALVAVTVWTFRTVPTGFIPAEDQGNLMITIQGPEGMSLGQADQVLHKVEKILSEQPEVKSRFVVGGFSFSGTGPNMAMIFVTLHPWEERTSPNSSVEAIVERLRPLLGRIGEARVMPFQPPTIRGVGSLGGFQFIVEERGGSRSLDEIASST